MTGKPIAIGGPPGCGKSTAARGLAERLHLRVVSAGEIFRAEAARRGLSLAEFSREAERDGSIDRKLDQRMLAEAVPGVVLEGRLQGALLRRERRPVLWLALTAKESVRADRLAKRDQVTAAQALADLRTREASERKRYREHYGVDLDRETPDLLFDSTEFAASEVVERLLEFIRSSAPRP